MITFTIHVGSMSTPCESLSLIFVVIYSGPLGETIVSLGSKVIHRSLGGMVSSTRFTTLLDSIIRSLGEKSRGSNSIALVEWEGKGLVRFGGFD